MRRISNTSLGSEPMLPDKALRLSTYRRFFWADVKIERSTASAIAL
jgi:hypothetical protein